MTTIWPSVPLSSIAEIIQGGRLKLSGNDFVDDGFPAYGAGGVNGFLPVAEFEKPAVVLSSIGARCGKCFLTEEKWTSLANTQVIVPNDDLADTQFLWYLLNDEGSWHRSGTAQPFIKPSDVKKRLIPLPPLDEQRRIAAILDKADEVRSKRKAALETLETLSQAIFIEMFGDPVTNPMGWPLEMFGGLTCNEDSLRVPVKLQDRSNRSGSYPYYGASGIIDHVDDYLFDGERLLIGEDGANLAVRSSPVAFIASGKYWVNNHAHVLRENGKSDIRYLERLIEFSDLKPFLSGSAQPKLNQANLARMMVICPPIALQRKFAEQVRKIRKTHDALETAVVEGDCLFTSLQNNAFQGAL